MFQDDLKEQITRMMERRELVDIKKASYAVVASWGVHDMQDQRYADAMIATLEKEGVTVLNQIKRRQYESAEQMELGLEENHLQSYYIVESVGYPIEKMTRAMLEAKANEHRMQGMGHFQHALEIEQYVSTKFDETAQPELAAEN